MLSFTKRTDTLNWVCLEIGSRFKNSCFQAPGDNIIYCFFIISGHKIAIMYIVPVCLLMLSIKHENRHVDSLILYNLKTVYNREFSDYASQIILHSSKESLEIRPSLTILYICAHILVSGTPFVKTN